MRGCFAPGPSGFLLLIIAGAKRYFALRRDVLFLRRKRTQKFARGPSPRGPRFAVTPTIPGFYVLKKAVFPSSDRCASRTAAAYAFFDGVDAQTYKRNL